MFCRRRNLACTAGGKTWISTGKIKIEGIELLSSATQPIWLSKRHIRWPKAHIQMRALKSFEEIVWSCVRFSFEQSIQFYIPVGVYLGNGEALHDPSHLNAFVEREGERERERESVGVLGSQSEHWSFLQLGWHNRPSFFFGASEDWFVLLTKYLLISLFLCIPMGSIYSFFTSLFFHLWDRDPFSTSSSLYTDLLF